MKMYIQNYDIQKLSKKCPLIDKYYTSTRQTCMLYSSEGIFMVDDTAIYKIDYTDGLVEKKDNLLIDSSMVIKTKSNQIPVEHIRQNVTTFYYVLTPKSVIQLVIEGIHKTDVSLPTNAYGLLQNRYADFNLVDFYFEAPNETDMNHSSVKEEINVFLSQLN